MATYVVLLNWTEQGIKDYPGTVDRGSSFREMVSRAGGQVRELLWTVGEYDIVCVLEVPDEETAVALLLQVGSLGNVRTKTMRAFDADQITGIIDRTS
ncbi:MAG: GYD domain-containing protein [Egibacteraceae bacterium]